MASADLYSAADILEQTLIAKTDVPVYYSVPRDGDGALPNAVVKSGNPVGVVYSWIGPDPQGLGIANLWWMFYGPNGTYYYAEHIPGRYDVSALKQQGILTAEQEAAAAAAAAADASKSWYEKLFDDVKPVLYTGIAVFAGIMVLTKVLPAIINPKKKEAE